MSSLPTRPYYGLTVSTEGYIQQPKTQEIISYLKKQLDCGALKIDLARLFIGQKFLIDIEAIAKFLPVSTPELDASGNSFCRLPTDDLIKAMGLLSQGVTHLNVINNHFDRYDKPVEGSDTEFHILNRDAEELSNIMGAMSDSLKELSISFDDHSALTQQVAILAAIKSNITKLTIEYFNLPMQYAEDIYKFISAIPSHISELTLDLGCISRLSGDQWKSLAEALPASIKKLSINQLLEDLENEDRINERIIAGILSLFKDKTEFIFPIPIHNESYTKLERALCMNSERYADYLIKQVEMIFTSGDSFRDMSFVHLRLPIKITCDNLDGIIAELVKKNHPTANITAALLYMGEIENYIDSSKDMIEYSESRVRLALEQLKIAISLNNSRIDTDLFSHILLMMKASVDVDSPLYTEIDGLLPPPSIVSNYIKHTAEVDTLSSKMKATGMFGKKERPEDDEEADIKAGTSPSTGAGGP